MEVQKITDLDIEFLGQQLVVSGSVGWRLSHDDEMEIAETEIDKVFIQLDGIVTAGLVSINMLTDELKEHIEEEMKEYAWFNEPSFDIDEIKRDMRDASFES